MPSESDDDLVEEKTAEERAHERRKKTPLAIAKDWTSVLGAVVAISAAALGAAAWTFDQIPVVKTSTYTHDMAENDVRVKRVEGQAQDLSTSVSQIQRNGLLTLQLQLQSRIDLIGSTMAGVQRTGPVYIGLQGELNAAQQQLDEVKRQLNR